MKKAKMIVAVMIMVYILFVGTVESYAMPVLNEKNSVSVDGKISKIAKVNGGYKVTVLVTEKGSWKNHKYSIRLSNYDWKSWKSEQGKIKVGQKVIALLYKNGTPKNVKDDKFVNIRKK